MIDILSGIKKSPDIEKVFVTGSTGNIGYLLTQALVGADYKVRALQHKKSIASSTSIEIVQGDVCDYHFLQQATKGVQAICHFIRAPYGSSFRKWADCCILGTQNLLEICRSNPSIRRLVIGSGDNIFGVPNRSNYDTLNENSSLQTNSSAYSLAKILEVNLLRQYMIAHQVPAVLTIFPLVWRKDLLPSGIRHVDHKEKIIRRYRDASGNDLIRQDIHINDAVRAIMIVLEKHESIGEEFIFASAEAYSDYDLVNILNTVSDYHIKTEKKTWHSWELNFTKAKRLLGFTPKYNLLEWLSCNYNIGTVSSKN